MTTLILPALILIPLLSGIATLMIRSDIIRRILLIATAAIHLLLTFASYYAAPALGEWLVLDALGNLFLLISSGLFLIACIYGVGYLAREKLDEHRLHIDFDDSESNSLFENNPESLLTGCLLFFLAAMSLVCVSNHLGLLWVAIEATTLASAPLIFFHKHRKSLEATWKYLLICSIGIALALFGNFLLAVSTAPTQNGELPLLLTQLLPKATQFQPLWLKAAFIFLLVGYGTKMGLAPLHTWLPDAHSESPSFVSALLSGALLNCAFLGILRAQQILVAANLAVFGQELLIGFGLLSMAFATTFILRQMDFKRMLAYSSVEHMGILALGIGLGGTAVFGSLLHTVNHSITKGMLFLVAGNILTVMHSKSTIKVRGLLQRLPVSSVLWLAGFLSITGSPPFGTFISEFTIFKAAIEQGHFWIAIGFIGILATIFVVMASIVLKMCFSTPRPIDQGTDHESWTMILPPLFLGILSLILGLYLPPFLKDLLNEAAHLLGGGL